MPPLEDIRGSDGHAGDDEPGPAHAATAADPRARPAPRPVPPRLTAPMFEFSARGLNPARAAWDTVREK
ncbi:hypothetical protein GCM10009560_34700 [Nonomuraea longicatena]|uniref:Uncharacterized protein n=1 Tax=Nonomuraea longicatena TaxID=83682 RepID=A0ABP4A210_9ACTN